MPTAILALLAILAVLAIGLWILFKKPKPR